MDVWFGYYSIWFQRLNDTQLRIKEACTNLGKKMQRDHFHTGKNLHTSFVTLRNMPSLQLGGGYLFGLPVGFVADSIGATIGAGAAFLLGRTVSFSSFTFISSFENNTNVSTTCYWIVWFMPFFFYIY